MQDESENHVCCLAYAYSKILIIIDRKAKIVFRELDLSS